MNHGPSSNETIAQCQDCAQGYVELGSVLTIHVQFVLPHASCGGAFGNFWCYGFQVTAVNINPPYTLASIIFGPLPQRICGSGEYNWTVSIQVPPTAGAFPISGDVDGAAWQQHFNPGDPTCVYHN